jgi:parallel beta-helix repeat protein
MGGMGLVAIAPYCSGLSIVHAQEVSEPGQSLLAQADATPPVFLVNPATGNDATADGSEQSPFKTITQALQVARSGTVILLMPGTYSAETGETFPILLKPGITLQGNPQTRGQGILIKGSGFFLSPTFARQKIAILGANQATLAGVTVTNPEPQGYGLWIESSSPIVIDNTFMGSTHDGISVNGQSNPLIRGNYFFENGANGITIYGTSRPEVRENIFEKTGFAINLNQKAAPLLIGNRITQNKDGIVAQATARPVLRNNSVEGNERDGLVAIAQSQPDLGTKTDPGGNFFRNNGQLDVNVKSSNQVIPAVGNEMSKTEGQLDLAATRANTQTYANAEPNQPVQLATNSFPAVPTTPVKAVSAKAPEGSVPPTIPFGQQLSTTNSQVVPTQTAPDSPSAISAASFPSPGSVQPEIPSAPDVSFPVPSALSGVGESAPPSRPLQMVAIAPLTSTPVAKSVPATVTPVIASGRSAPVQIPVPTPESSRAGGSQSPVSLARYSPTPTAPIEIPVPPPEIQPNQARSVVRPPTLLPPTAPVQSATLDVPNLLPVPGPDAPLGNIGDMPTVNIYRNIRQGDRSNPPVPPSRTSALGFRYRVIVDADDVGVQANVRSLVPDAFRSSFQGRTVMQVGAFTEREKADELIQSLANQGIQAILEQLQ